MKRLVMQAGVLILVTAGVGVLVTVSGVIPIKASSDHWAITKWMLTFAMSRSVTTNSSVVEAPSGWDEASMIMKGAGHFETGCASCHGSPIWNKPRIARGLRPTPPRLLQSAGDWTPEELFYIVKHGVKFTGMPAFPSQQRDDEVWAVVAFLHRLPDLDEVGYRDLVFGDQPNADENVPQVVVHVCARCHGVGGMAREAGAFPRIAGLHVDYFAATMNAYARGERHSGIMEPIAARLTAEQVTEVATYYSKLPRNPDDKTEMPVAGADIERGKGIAFHGIPDQDVGACIACHREDRSEHNPTYPLLGGQDRVYLELQLRLFQQRRRGGTNAQVMHGIADGLKDSQIRDVAAYYSLRAAKE